MPLKGLKILGKTHSKQRLDRGAVQIIRRLSDAGHETYLVGGAVRDLLVGVTPKDFDISTSATPEEVIAAFGKRNLLFTLNW